ncbi:MAG: cytidine deaminase [Erysipelotrichaceae bacterium]|nr:cytidine deaminase [Erysipelotrichaceae bacterium]
MKKKLQDLLNNSYTPYYQYSVAAIVIMKDGTEFGGVNVETSSPAAGICAERNALYTAITFGYKKGDVKEIHVMSKTEDDCFPCFICRHALSDFCDRDVKVFSHTYSDSRIVTHTVSELCPYPFSDDNLRGSL